jgi:hypothetical protein
MQAMTASQMLSDAAVVIVKSTLPAPAVSLVFKDLRYFVPNPALAANKEGKRD